MQISPQGKLPVLKDGDLILIDEDKTISYLEKQHKLVRFALPKKKKYQPLLQRCKEIFEPMVSQLIDNSGFPSLEPLLQELSFINNSIKGPFFLGGSISWVKHPTSRSINKIYLLQLAQLYAKFSQYFICGFSLYFINFFFLFIWKNKVDIFYWTYIGRLELIKRIHDFTIPSHLTNLNGWLQRLEK